MSTFTAMKTTLRDEATIPMLAVEAFNAAFKEATHSEAPVIYVKEQKLVEQNNGIVKILDDLSAAYALPKLKHSVLRRKKKQEVIA